MKNQCTWQIYEVASASNKDGRRNIKMILHKIFPDNSTWQENGISWSESYTQNCLDSIQGMSICAEFLDSDRESPYGHGLTDTKDNLPIFEDATMVGVCHRGYIDTVNIKGIPERVCIAEGHIDEMRYPKFVQWIEEHIETDGVYGSVEIIGLPQNNNRIVYAGGFREKGRVPKEYKYSGYAILSIRPADDTAMIVELNSTQKQKEETHLDERMINQMISEIKAAVVGTISETNSKSTDYESKIAELNASIEGKDDQIDKLNAKCKKYEDEAAEKEKDLESKEKELRDAVETNASLLKEKAIIELNAALADFTDDQKNFAKDDIAAFNDDPGKLEINSIIGKICRGIVEEARKSKASHEENSSSAEDIFGYVDEANCDNADDIF